MVGRLLTRGEPGNCANAECRCNGAVAARTREEVDDEREAQGQADWRAESRAAANWAKSESSLVVLELVFRVVGVGVWLLLFGWWWFYRPDPDVFIISININITIIK